MEILKQLEQEFSINSWQVENTIALIDDGNTIPFIARYRKEKTGSLNDEILRNFHERLLYLRSLEEKKQQVIKTIEDQGKLTDTLKKQILLASTLVEVDDLYRPYRPKRRTRATIAKEKGLEPLAEIILQQKTQETIESLARGYIDEEKGVKSEEEAIQGAKDIIAEIISDNADYRKWIRKNTYTEGSIISKAKKENVSSVYEMYYDYQEPIKRIVSHRILAINRGEKEKILNIKIEAPEELIIYYLEKKIIIQNNQMTNDILKNVIQDSYKRLIAPAIEREIRNELTENAEEGAIKVFAKNLEQLLMQPPIIGKVVLGLDPAFRTGCKIAVVDSTGKVLDTTVVYPTPPQNKTEQAKKTLISLIKKHNVSLIAIGNGTASRESEQFVADMLKEIKENVQYIIVNEAGASVYSASKLGTEEFPDFDVAQRSAISIARRLQDPLAELVKIDPKSIGVGQYQHDMNQKKLSETLTGVVEGCVNRVGVDLNTASAALLRYISGITKTIAANIVNYREENGRFTSRKQLLKVSKLGPKAYEQCAGFLRIQDGKHILDTTGVHPESYKETEELLTLLNYNIKDIGTKNIRNISSKINNIDELATQIGLGIPTLKDIIKELEKPGRDPREDMPKPILRTDVLEMKDLKDGMILKGTVRNVIDFGAFVDIGVHQDGLVHISEMTDHYIKHPLEVVSVSDIVDVKVLSVDVDKKRIALTMKI